MNIGDLVQVNDIWAGGSAMHPILTHWFKGYIVHSINEKVIQVKKTSGVFAGCIYNYKKKDVRYAIT